MKIWSLYAYYLKEPDEKLKGAHPKKNENSTSFSSSLLSNSFSSISNFSWSEQCSSSFSWISISSAHKVKWIKQSSYRAKHVIYCVLSESKNLRLMLLTARHAKNGKTIVEVPTSDINDFVFTIRRIIRWGEQDIIWTGPIVIGISRIRILAITGFLQAFNMQQLSF